MALQYRVGDATQPVGNDSRVIVHVCNDVGAWGAGFVAALSRRWDAPEFSYREWYAGDRDVPFALGQVMFVPVEDRLCVANMVAQHDFQWEGDQPPLRYEVLKECLTKVVAFAREHNASVHMPRIRSGIAGGDWNRIEKIVEETVVANGVPVTVYDLAQR